MEQNMIGKEPGFFEKNKILIKGLLIGFLILLMLIPASLVSELVYERQNRQAEVIEEVSSKWASGQTIKGPVLMVPYKIKQALKNGTVTESLHHFYLLPETLHINGKVLPEVRHRSLYDVTLYRSELVLSGSFNTTAMQQLHIAPENILWAESNLIIGINDARGLEENVVLQWDGLSKPVESGMPANGLINIGLSTIVNLKEGPGNSFTIKMKLKGSSELYFTPVGKTTDVVMNSTWESPAFDGQYLPDKTAKVGNDGFNAHWKILQVSRNYPQSWLNSDNYDISKSAFGVKLIQPADGYAKTKRSVKYAILFIALTFTVFFFIEVIQKKQVHPLQYLLVGFALCIFYTLLLSISEYTGFNPAYLIAAIATISLIGTYVWGIFKQLKIAAGFTGALSALYGYIFILIQLEDYALLFGSVGLFVILAIVMYYSRKIDWYGIHKHQPETT